uniref:Carboxylic ester hydrolase n=1 Tax=Panagrolaimus davidi TaxID=227884 RepID=A0A914Q534_9BILA
MLWIHGGSLKTGSAQSYATGSIIRNFISRGVIVVTIQYRLGMLGYFTTFTDDFPPNRGALDQVEAIKFVKDEIKNFGGNPFQITLFGQSAGSASVAAHLFSPLSQSLFQGAIMESGSVLTCFDGALGFQNTSVEWAQQLCNFTSDNWNALNYTELTNCLSNMPFSKWLPLDDNLLLGWQMVQDNYFLPDVPRNLASKRPNIPVMYGNCRDEWSYFDLSFLRDGLTKLSDYSKGFFELFFGTMASYLASREFDVVGMLEGVYTPFGTSDDDHLVWFKIQNDIFTSTGFTGFITREIDWHLLNGNKQVYAYEITYESQIGRFYELPGWTRKLYKNTQLFEIF